MALILSANAGSSSLKLSLYSVADGGPGVDLVLTSTVSSISSPPAKFSFGGDDVADEPVDGIRDHASAFDHFLKRLQSKASIDSSRIGHICHRVVHGGDYTQPVEITEQSYHHIEELSDLAPLHNGAALSVIAACIKSLPNAKSIAYFDTTFHTTLPPSVSTYAIDQAVAAKKGLRKYGFHGLSYSFIVSAVSKFLNKPASSVSLIVLHLGSGASACAVRDGKSIDTSMGLTPVHGLPGATRSGSIDPSLIFHYTSNAGKISHDPALQAMHVGLSVAEDILNRKSGWRALCGTTDFGEIVRRAELERAAGEGEGEVAVRQNPYRLAFELFVDRVLDYVGSYHLKLDARVDALVFAGGIGERSVELRSVLGEKVRCLGYKAVDREKNLGAGAQKDVVCSVSVDEGGDSGCGHAMGQILVVKTDEQLEMARLCALDKRFWK